ncbi:MAG: hypothetical protein PHI66_03755 [Candidatus Pacebacteria bacterium]|nr:hypothetical protein [Candidatus Paceibacterota bacterium]
MVELIDKVDIDKLKTTEKIKKEIERFQKFSYIIGGEETSTKATDVNIKNYAKYILLEGTKQEKRELLECLKSKIRLKEKNIYLK